MTTRKKTTTKTTKVSTAKTSSFVDKVLQLSNKSQEQKEREAVEKFVKDSIIDCKTQITLIEISELPKLQLKKEQFQRTLGELTEEFEKSKFTIKPDFTQYVHARDEFRRKISTKQNEIARLDEEIRQENERLKQFNEILADLQS